MDRDPRELDGAWTRSQRHGSVPPPADLAPFVERFWTAEWDYPEPYRQKIVPYPHVHLTVRPGAPAEVHGVATRHVVRELAGPGRVAGVAFRPGAFRAFLGRPVAALTDRVVPAGEVPALAAATGQPEPVGADGVADDVGVLRARVRAALPVTVSRTAGEATALVARIATDRALTRVDALAAATGTSIRSLQRLFAEHVGVGPKWVIRRYRLHEVTERMAAGEPVRWTDVAAELGYADQAHMTREFTALFGEPPTAYARRY
ncbi:helix-turn-helix domain-containing protein [Pseudonocardia nematodicida]|uniref:Helix-turn-helix domain-containing protein n=1 Tax=Pseudonocardia nematodicida TaxID=1206997 RepID=A0ABV1KF08_9PSEU